MRRNNSRSAGRGSRINGAKNVDLRGGRASGDLRLLHGCYRDFSSRNRKT
jgi:hypothetical protein